MTTSAMMLLVAGNVVLWLAVGALVGAHARRRAARTTDRTR